MLTKKELYAIRFTGGLSALHLNRIFMIDTVNNAENDKIRLFINMLNKNHI